MGQASASASASSGINASGGNIYANSPTTIIVIVLGIIAVVWIYKKLTK